MSDPACNGTGVLMRRRSLLGMLVLCIAVITGACAAGISPQDGPSGLSSEYKDLNDKSAALFKEGKFDQSLEAAEKAVQIEPDHPFGWNNKGIALLALGRNEEALEAVNRSIELNSDNPIAWNNKGAALHALGRTQEALQATEEALMRDPQNAILLYNKACYHAALDERAAALQDLQAAFEINPDLKASAREDKDLRKLADDKEFKKLVE